MRNLLENENFRRWFKGSRVVNSDGSPKIMYHGTRSDIESFDPARIKAVDTDAPFNGFWFSEDHDTSPAFVDPTNIMPVYLAIRNPAPWQVWREVVGQVRQSEELPERSRSHHDEVRHRLGEMGYDGIIFDQAPQINADELNQTGRYEYRNVRGGREWLQNDVHDEVEWGEIEDEYEAVEGELIEPDGSREPMKISIPDIAPILFSDGSAADLSEFDIKTLLGTIRLPNGNVIVSRKVDLKTTYQGWRNTGRKETRVGYYTGGTGHVIDYTDLNDFLASHTEVWVCFFPNQIKSVYNGGTWNAHSPNISEGLRAWIDIVSE